MSGSHKTCYVCCVYFGERRSAVREYDEDRLSYVREHVKTLQEVLHNLDHIVFAFNLEEDQFSLFQKAKKIIPRKIQGATVEILQRENKGMSYGAWSDVYVKYQEKYDYYIFNEDDYFFTKDYFDDYLVKKFESFDNVGYLCGMAMNPAPGTNWVTHAGNSVGISSHKVLHTVYEKFGCLPHGKAKIENLQERYGQEEQEGQISQTHEIFKMGYNIFDIRDDYVMPHDMGPYLKYKWPDYDHFVDQYFAWNNEYLLVPAPIKFNHPVFFINVVDPQYQRKKTCYIINFYFGERRRTVEEFHTDPLCFLRKHIETLNQYHHNLTKIVFNINAEPSQFNYVNEAIKIVPKKIRNSEVELVIRENVGFSYGAFSDNFEKNRNDYDYFIFNEDDYFLVDHNWDEYLIRKYNQLPSSGYFTALQRDEDEKWNDGKIHAGHCFGIASTENLNKVWEKYGCLPHTNRNDYVEQEKTQIDFSHSFVSLGMRVYDIREEYRLAFAMTEQDHQDIWRWWWWNERDLIIPAIIAFEKPYSWWESYDGPCLRKTNLEKYHPHEKI